MLARSSSASLSSSLCSSTSEDGTMLSLERISATPTSASASSSSSSSSSELSLSSSSSSSSNVLDELCDALRRSKLILLLVLELSDAMRGVELVEKEGVEGARVGVAGARIGVADTGVGDAGAGVAGCGMQSQRMLTDKGRAGTYALEGG